jgi:hypothetical protein
VLCELDCFWVGWEWEYIILPKVKLATVVTLDSLGKGVFRACVGRGVYMY